MSPRYEDVVALDLDFQAKLVLERLSPEGIASLSVTSTNWVMREPPLQYDALWFSWKKRRWSGGH